MTTNHVGKLDPALFRPGRCDLTIHLTRCGPQEVAQLFKIFYRRCFTSADFEHIPAGVLSPASISSMLLRCRDNPDEGMLQLASMAALESASGDDVVRDQDA